MIAEISKIEFKSSTGNLLVGRNMTIRTVRIGHLGQARMTAMFDVAVGTAKVVEIALQLLDQSLKSSSFRRDGFTRWTGDRWKIIRDRDRKMIGSGFAVTAATFGIGGRMQRVIERDHPPNRNRTPVMACPAVLFEDSMCI